MIFVKTSGTLDILYKYSLSKMFKSVQFSPLVVFLIAFVIASFTAGMSLSGIFPLSVTELFPV